MDIIGSNGPNPPEHYLQNNFDVSTNQIWKEDNLSNVEPTTECDSNPISRLHAIVESACSAESRSVVERVFRQVDQLSNLERLLLYLKLPTVKQSEVDTLKIPLNPLGSRSEIQQTIVWIRTHLEEDPEVSMPKHEVYDEYQVFCSNSSMKGLSTADFGKVMKQVFPRVRPRRLGTRGHSRYCYAGLRRRVALEPPMLADLDQLVDKLADGKLDSAGADQPHQLTSSHLIQEWAEKVTGLKFDTISQLTDHLMHKNYACTGVTPAGLLPAVGPTAVDRHRETQLQLQRKIQEKELVREQRKRLQDCDGRPGRGGAVRKRRKCSAEDGGEELSDRYMPWVEPGVAPHQAVGSPFLFPPPPPPPPSGCQSGLGSTPLSCVNVSSMSGGGAVCSPSSGASYVQQHNRHPHQLQHNGYVPSPPSHHSSTPAAAFNRIKPKLERCDPAAGGVAAEQEDELLDYFGHQHSKEHQQKEELSQLRLLLEQNLPSSKEGQKVLGVTDPRSAQAQLLHMHQTQQQLLPPPPRRVSFQTGLSAAVAAAAGVIDGSASAAAASSMLLHQQHVHQQQQHLHPSSGPVPPSPNSRRRCFNFQPICHQQQLAPPDAHWMRPPADQLPPVSYGAVSAAEQLADRSRHGSGQPGGSMRPGTATPFSVVSEMSRCATFGSENSTPFLSPQSTPVPFSRSRHNSSQQPPPSGPAAASACRFGGVLTPVQQLQMQVRSRHSSSGAVVASSLACRQQLNQQQQHSAPLHHHPAQQHLYSPINPNPYSPMSLQMCVDESGMQTSNFPTPDGTPSVRSPQSSSPGSAAVSPPMSPGSALTTPVIGVGPDCGRGLLLGSSAAASCTYSELRRRHQSAAAALPGATAVNSSFSGVQQRRLSALTVPAAAGGATGNHVGGVAAGMGSVDLERLAAELGSLAPDLSSLLSEPQRSQSVPPPSAAPMPPAFNTYSAELNVHHQPQSAALPVPSICNASGLPSMAHPSSAATQDTDLGQTLEALSECDNNDFSRLMLEASHGGVAN